MNVSNVHSRCLNAPASRVGELIGTLGGENDHLWPRQCWPPMKLDPSLLVGATGGHGPVRYHVEQLEPGRRVQFRFLAPRGFEGWHAFEILPVSESETILRHTLKMRATGPALLTWPLAFRWLHDALIEDALSRAQLELGETPTIVAWPGWVKILRWLVSGGKAGSQQIELLPGTKPAPQG